ncbi:hypothetical protein D022_2666A, partial [Vibrio parahaemolyticus 12310]
MHLVG